MKKVMFETRLKEFQPADHEQNCRCLTCPHCGIKEVDDCHKPLAECVWNILKRDISFGCSDGELDCQNCGHVFEAESIFYTRFHCADPRYQQWPRRNVAA